MQLQQDSTYRLVTIQTTDVHQYAQVEALRQVLVTVGYENSPQRHIDESAEIFLLYFGSEPVATVRVLHKPGVSFYFGRLAAKKTSPNSRHGFEIMKRVLEILLKRAQPQEEIWAVSQPNVFAFHAKIACLPTGAPFVHSGALVNKIVFCRETWQKL